MARGLTAFDLGAGFAQYVLGQGERFTPLAFTALVQNNAVTPVFMAYLQWRDATNYPIATQFVGAIQTHACTVSFSDGTEPFYVDQNANQDYPQLENYYVHSFIGMRMPLIPLEPRCSFGIYLTVSGAIPNETPITFFDPDSLVVAPHLWVDDAGAAPRLPAPPEPLLVHAA